MPVKRTRHLELLFSSLVEKLRVSEENTALRVSYLVHWWENCVSMKRTQQGLELVSSLVENLRVSEENTALRVII